MLAKLLVRLMFDSSVVSRLPVTVYETVCGVLTGPSISNRVVAGDGINKNQSSFTVAPPMTVMESLSPAAKPETIFPLTPVPPRLTLNPEAFTTSQPAEANAALVDPTSIASIAARLAVERPKDKRAWPGRLRGNNKVRLQSADDWTLPHRVKRPDPFRLRHDTFWNSHGDSPSQSAGSAAACIGCESESVLVEPERPIGQFGPLASSGQLVARSTQLWERNVVRSGTALGTIRNEKFR
ncbi:MAG: hypothetical protein E6G85_30675 [Alphaproteobacteria bacterium]|nr:MAG: hypothetical protein E6G85_30675 [Alphaproteobacteria bacterium]